MTRIILTVARWLIRKLGLLLLLIGALLLVPSVLQALQTIRDFDPEHFVPEAIQKTKDITPDKNSAPETINARLAELRSRLEQKKAERDRLAQDSCFLPTCWLDKEARIYRVEAEIEVLTQALAYGEAVPAMARGQKACEAYDKNRPILYQLRQSDIDLEQARPRWAPVSPAHQRIKDRIAELEAIQARLIKACQLYRKASAFDPDPRAVQTTLDARHDQFLAYRKAISQVPDEVWAVLPSALWLLLGIVLTPLGLKTLAYYGIAPLATRAFGVRLQPAAAGELRVVSPSSHLQRIEIKAGEELLLDPALLRSAPDEAQKNTQYLLDWSMPLTSIAAGMYRLTRIRHATEGTITVGADEGDEAGSSAKLVVLDIPEHAALVLQPRCLAGIVQRTERPIRITRHWRVGSLGSWLTWQLRYVVFHGPAKLILKGNNGIEVDPVTAGTALTQATTLGFSANLTYAVSRCETFDSYLSGKRPLFIDRFSSGPGFCLHEVSAQPRPKGVQALTRPVDFVWNALTTALGI